MSTMTETGRAATRILQDRAIKAIELLFPDCEDLDAQRVYGNGPTVGEARQYIYSDLGWLWLDWIEQGKTAGHDI